jgi:hypothetical protein
MKTRSTRRPRRLVLNLAFYESYTNQIYEIETALARKPETFQIDLIGSGELSPDTALLIRSVLQNRSAQTHLITNARSSLQGGSVLVWLLGDTRLMRDDAHLYFRRPVSQSEDGDREAWKDDEPSASDLDMEELDYARVLQHINEYLPVKELAGCAIDLRVLKQFGLVDNAKGDLFLASAFAKRGSHLEVPLQEPVKTQSPPTSKVPPSQQ